MCLLWEVEDKKNSIQVLMKPELSITDTVVAAVKCSLQHGGG